MKTSKKLIAILLAALIVALCAVVFAACDKTPAHDHEWEVTGNTATCTEAGDIVSKCKVCGEEKREPTAALGHDLDEENIEVIEKATCEHDGSGKATCKRCSNKETVVIPKLPHNITRPDFDRSYNATCTKAGVRAGKCSMCGKDVEVELPALGHDFSGVSELVSEPSCETEGEIRIKCSRKNCDGDGSGNGPAYSVTKSPALGHDWQTWKTVDQEPTFEQAGKRSVHCNRCEKTKDDEILPMLVAGQKSTYRFRVARFNQEPLKIGLNKVKITVKDANGNQVAVSDNDNFNQVTATLTVELEPAAYTVTVEGLPDGYTAESSYAIQAGDVYKDLIINAALLPEDKASDSTKYNLGSVLHDYTFKDVRGGNGVKLSDLLANHDIVLLNFFFVACGACQSEMPGLVSAYNIYKDNMAVVMLDCVPGDTNDKIISNFLQPFKVPMDWVVAQDITPNNPDPNIDYTNICEKFKSTSAPQNIIVDKEGVVVYWEIGSTSEMKFRDTFKKYTSAPYKKTEPTSPAQQTKTALVDLDIPRKDGDSGKEEQ